MSLFRRRVRASRFRHVREFFWPSLGFRRSTLYLVHRVRRLPDTPYSIAAGFACGTAVAFTPLLGLHFFLAAVLAWILRANLLASALGTLIGNPWTLPFIFVWLYHLGHWMMADTPSRPLPVHLTLDYVFNHPWRVLVPMSLGAIPMTVGVWVLTFIPVRWLIAGYQRRRHHRRVALRVGRQRHLRPETATDQEPRG